MSELKDYSILDIEAIDDERLEKSESGRIQETRVYIKSEADKVIAERKEKYNELAKLHDKAIQACCDADKVIAHHKYKRCLANAWWCRNLSKTYAWSAYNHRGWKIAKYYDKKAELYRKWHKRWLELAEKFKD